MNQSRMRDVATPIRSPIAEHTPNAFHSINDRTLIIFLYIPKITCLISIKKINP